MFLPEKYEEKEGKKQIERKEITKKNLRKEEENEQYIYIYIIYNQRLSDGWKQTLGFFKPTLI